MFSSAARALPGGREVDMAGRYGYTISRGTHAKKQFFRRR